MPCPFTCPKIFWAGQNFVCQTKNLSTHCCARQKDDMHIAFSKLGFCASTKVLEEAQNVCDCYEMYINFWSATKNLDQPKTFWDL